VAVWEVWAAWGVECSKQEKRIASVRGLIEGWMDGNTLLRALYKRRPLFDSENVLIREFVLLRLVPRISTLHKTLYCLLLWHFGARLALAFVSY
jgi:hypothetical protein